MITEAQLIGSICRIKCGTQHGTGFFISGKTILTCYHVVLENSPKNPIQLTQNNVTIEVKITAYCTETDLAVLEVLNGFVSQHYLPLRQSTPVNQLDWRTFGHPANGPGQLVGEPLNGTVVHVIPDSSISIYDISCNVTPSGLPNPIYKGFSGSPMLNDSGSVIGVMKYEGSNHLHGVSIKKGTSFLTDQNIQVLADELDGFADYAEAAFEGFSPEAKSICKDFAIEIAKVSSPTGIATALVGDVYYPSKTGSLLEVIAGIKRNSENSILLWTGWLELLSYVALMQGQHQDINAITITLPAEKLTKWLGLVTKINPGRKLQLRFLWTEEENYFSVLKEYLRGKQRGGMEKNTCHIFNAKSRNFGGDVLKPNFKTKIIGDISSPKGSGPSVMTNINYGLLSLRHLNNEVKQCSTLAEATINLEKLFKDAIEQS